MGDFADDALDRSIDEWCNDLDYPDPSDDPHYNPFPSRKRWHRHYPKGIKCRYCGTPGLSWHYTSAGWRLFNGGVMHSCQRYRHTR